jgi:hypothetical protein
MTTAATATTAMNGVVALVPAQPEPLPPVDEMLFSYHEVPALVTLIFQYSNNVAIMLTACSDRFRGRYYSRILTTYIQEPSMERFWPKGFSEQMLRDRYLQMQGCSLIALRQHHIGQLDSHALGVAATLVADEVRKDGDEANILEFDGNENFDHFEVAPRMVRQMDEHLAKSFVQMNGRYTYQNIPDLKGKSIAEKARLVRAWLEPDKSVNGLVRISPNGRLSGTIVSNLQALPPEYYLEAQLFDYEGSVSLHGDSWRVLPKSLLRNHRFTQLECHPPCKAFLSVFLLPAGFVVTFEDDTTVRFSRK